jgi:hypothetical protein
VYCQDANPYQIGELILSEWYLPRLVVTASAICLAATTALNVGLITSLSLSNVLERAGIIYLVGLKARSAQLQCVAITGQPNEIDEQNEEIPDEIRIENTSCMRAVKILVENAKRVSALLGLPDVNLTSCLSQKSRTPKLAALDFYDSICQFWDYHDSHHVSSRDLRRLCAHIDLLSPGGSIYTVQTLLGHADAKTTLTYINTNIVNLLLDANVMRFMKKLAATILFSTGRKGLLSKHGLSENDVQPLLFPVSEASNRSSAADDWIESNGTLKLSIGSAELKHCATQYAYYKRRFLQLCSENPLRFSSIHLPRILFCFALRKVILASPHAAQLINFEEGLS